MTAIAPVFVATQTSLAAAQAVIERAFVLRRALSTALAPWNIDWSSANTLLLITACPEPPKVSDITRSVLPQTMTDNCDTLERRGLIERVHGTKDRRAVLVHITEAGRALIAEITPCLEEAASQFFTREGV